MSTTGLLPIERRIQAGFAAGLIALGALSTVSYLAIHRLLEQSQQVEHSRQVLEATDTLLKALADADRARMAFSLSGDHLLVEPFKQAVQGTRDAFGTLRALTADNTEQQRRLEQAQPLIDERLAYLSAAMRRSPGEQAGLRPQEARSEAERVADRPIRRVLQTFTDAERQLLLQREERAQLRGQRAAQFVVGLSAFALVLVAIALIVVGRAFDKARRIVNDLQEEHTRLEASMRQRSEEVARVNATLQESQQRLASVIGSAMDAVISVDEQQRVTLFNSAAESMFGYGRQEVLGAPLDQLIPQRYRSSHRNHIREFGRTQGTQRRMGQLGRVYGLRRDGTEFPVEAAISQSEAGGHKVYTVILRDVSERLAAEGEILRLNAELERRVEERTAELRAANQELESFGYSVAHDLRAPLRAMDGFSQALMEDYGEQIEGEARVYLNQIVRGSEHMSELIDGLLQLSRSVRGELRRDRVDMTRLAKEILAEMARGDPQRVVSWQVQEGMAARADARMMEIVLRNLLGNAWKYTSGVPGATIRVHAQDEGARRTFVVTDNGVGFNMAHAQKLFEPFQRLHRQDEFPGIGIGLATVQRIVRRHGGQIRATASLGAGAEFAFSLPLSSEDVAGVAHGPEDDAAGRGQPARRTADLAGVAQGEPGQPGRGRA